MAGMPEKPRPAGLFLLATRMGHGSRLIQVSPAALFRRENLLR